jgi:parallel beta-helix repeat protein
MLARLSLTLALLGTTAAAGPLTPPGGPVAPTMKTLAEVEPRIAINATNTPGDADSLCRITQSGSYYLTGNITGVAGKHGIEIASNNVTLDLNGFRLSGNSSTLDGIAITQSQGRGIIIRNGIVELWGDCGIEADYNFGSPPSAIIQDISANRNTRHGIYTLFDNHILRCHAEQNDGDGIIAGAGSSVIECTAAWNGGDGISASTGSIVSNCRAKNNTGIGFSIALGSTVSGCAAFANAVGFSSQGSSILNCTAYDNEGSGFQMTEGNSVSRCSSYRNVENGFNASGSNSITDCIATANDLDGIRVSSNSTVRGNQCTLNGNGTNDGAGILATGSDNRIEDNNCSDADRGIDINAAGNIIFRNTCSGNTLNWDVAAGNVCLVISGVAGLGAISGDSGGVSPGSTNPNANYTY